MDNTITNSSGKTMYLTVANGVTYGYMTARARRELFNRLGLNAWGS